MGKRRFALLVSIGLSFTLTTVVVAIARAGEELDKGAVQQKALDAWYSANDLVKQEKFDEAAKLYDEALERFDSVEGPLSEKNSERRIALGTYYDRHDQSKHARRWFEDAMIKFPPSKSERSSTFADLLLVLGKIYFDEGAYQRAELVLRRCVDIRTESLNDESEETVFALGVLCKSLEHQYKLNDALESATRALDMRDRTALKDATSSIWLLQQTSNLHYAVGNAEKARQLMERSLPLIEAEYGPESERYASALHKLAVVNGDLDQNDVAAERLDRSLKIYENLDGKESAKVVPVLRDIAALASNNGEYERAQELLTRSLELLKNEPNTVPEEIATLYADLANSSLAACRPPAEVTKYVDKAVEAARFASELDPDFQIDLKLLQADAALANGDLSFALSCATEAVSLCEQYFPRGPSMVDCLTTMAEAQRHLREYEDANATLDRAGLLTETAGSSEQAARIATLRAYVLVGLGKYSQAEEHLESMLKSAGDRVDRVSAVLFARAHLHLATQDHNDAVRDYRRAIKEIGDSWNERHPEAAAAHAALASALRYSGDCQQAMKEIVPAHDALLAYYGADHARTASAGIVLAKILADEGKFDEALAKCKAAVDVYRKKLGDDHQTTQQAAEAYEGIECLKAAATPAAMR